MRYHFSIDYPGDFGPISAWLRERAAADPLVAVAPGPRDYYSLVFTSSPEFATQQQQQFDAGHGAYCGVCVVEVAPEHRLLRVNLECGNQESAAAAAFITALFDKFPNYSVYDEDSSEDITALVQANPDELFDA
jgi:hypothetical protein